MRERHAPRTTAKFTVMKNRRHMSASGAYPESHAAAQQSHGLPPAVVLTAPAVRPQPLSSRCALHKSCIKPAAHHHLCVPNLSQEMCKGETASTCTAISTVPDSICILVQVKTHTHFRFANCPLRLLSCCSGEARASELRSVTANAHAAAAIVAADLPSSFTRLKQTECNGILTSVLSKHAMQG